MARRQRLSIFLVCVFLCSFGFFIGNKEYKDITKWFQPVQPQLDPMPTIFAITPTYARLVQKAELTRLSSVFLQVPKLHWIVVEDSTNKTRLVSSLLQKCKLPFTHLNVRSPINVKHCKGTLQRNLALSWLRAHFNVNSSVKGVVYFADDDNTYNLEVFEEMRDTKNVSVWPVGFAGGLRYESIEVDTSGKVKKWKVHYDPSRPFAIDMAGFAVNLGLILKKPHARFHLSAISGYQESSLLQDLVTIEELEPKAQNCTKVLVWHTRTEMPNISRDKNFTDWNTEV